MRQALVGCRVKFRPCSPWDSCIPETYSWGTGTFSGLPRFHWSCALHRILYQSLLRITLVRELTRQKRAKPTLRGTAVMTTPSYNDCFTEAFTARYPRVEVKSGNRFSHCLRLSFRGQTRLVTLFACWCDMCRHNTCRNSLRKILKSIPVAHFKIHRHIPCFSLRSKRLNFEAARSLMKGGRWCVSRDIKRPIFCFAFCMPVIQHGVPACYIGIASAFYTDILRR